MQCTYVLTVRLLRALALREGGAGASGSVAGVANAAGCDGGCGGGCVSGACAVGKHSNLNAYRRPGLRSVTCDKVSLSGWRVPEDSNSHIHRVHFTMLHLSCKIQSSVHLRPFVGLADLCKLMSCGSRPGFHLQSLV